MLDKAEAKNGSEKKASLEPTLTKKKKEYKELILMKERGLLSDDEFMELKTPQKSEIEALQRALSKNEDKVKVVDTRAHKAFLVGIETIFKKGTVQEKKDTLSELGSNETLKDKKLNVYNTGVYEKIINGLLTAKAENARFEPEKCQATKDKTGVFASVCPTLLGR